MGGAYVAPGRREGGRVGESMNDRRRTGTLPLFEFPTCLKAHRKMICRNFSNLLDALPEFICQKTNLLGNVEVLLLSIITKKTMRRRLLLPSTALDTII